MSKAIKEFFTKARTSFDLKAKFKAAWTSGARILPSRSAKNDAAWELRIDAGELVNNRFRNLVLQVNTQAKTTALKNWVRKNGTHAKLATATYDTAAPDQDKEVHRVIEDMETQAKKNL